MRAQTVTPGADLKHSSLKPFLSTGTLWARNAGYLIVVAALSAAVMVSAPSSSSGQPLASDPLQAQVVAKNPFPPSPPSDPVVAKVNGAEVRESDLAIAEEALGSKALPSREGIRRENLVKYLTDVIIMSDVAKQRRVADWGYMQRVQRRIEFIRNEALMKKLLQTVAAAAITDEALRKAYEETASPPEPELHVRSIAFRFKDPADQAAVKAAEMRAKEASRRIKDGKDFALVAKQMSESPGEPNSQDMGYVTRAMMGGELADAAFTLDAGGVSQPIKTNIGWFVIKVEDKRARQSIAFESVKDSLRATVARNAQLQFISDLRAQAKIELMDKAQAKTESPDEEDESNRKSTK
jgi:peptidyl-prolyl cis-trans isomerase C